MAQLQSTLKLTLLDQVSARARHINKSLEGLQRRTSGMLAFSRNIAAIGATYLGATAGIDGTYVAAQKMEAALAEIGIKAGLTNEHLQAMHRQLTALSPKVNQTTTDLVAGVDAMVTLGLATDKAQASIPAIAKAATATGSSIADLASASTSAIQNLGVAPEQITKMLDAMTLAGNAGAFEMRDMAQHFASLTAQAQSLGIVGVDGVSDLAAALQIARRGAADASSAATNLSNFMGKILSPEVSKNFKKFGVDVTKELKKAHKQGISPIEHFIKLVDEKTKGGQADLLGQLFGDQQVQAFIRPMIKDFKDYIAIREQAERATGTVDAAYARRMQTNAEKTKALRIQIENLGESVGAKLLTPVGDFAKHLSDILATLGERVTVFDRISTSIQGFTKGLGIGGLSDIGKAMEEFIFGVRDGSKAADEMGGIFARFEGYGKSIREFGLSLKQGIEDFETAMGIKPGTILETLEKVGGMGFKLALAGVGIGIAAAAVKKLSGALYWLSGASTAVGILKTIADLSGKFGGGATASALGTAATASGTAYGQLFAAAAGSAIAAGILVALRELDPKGDLWGTTTDFDAWVKEKTGWSPSQDGWSPGQVADELLPFRKGAKTLYNLMFPDIDPGTKSRPDPGGYDMSARSAYANSPAGVAEAAVANARRPPALMTGTSEHHGKMRDDANMGSRTIRTALDSASISALLQPSGVQDVREINKQPPNITVQQSITITGVVDPKAAAAASMSEAGEKIKAAVESTNTD